MSNTNMVRRSVVAVTALAMAGLGVAAMAQPPGALYVGVPGLYRAEMNGKMVVITVTGTLTDRLKLVSSRPTEVPNVDVVVKKKGDTLVNVEDDGKVVVNLKARPITLTYKPTPDITFTAPRG